MSDFQENVFRLLTKIPKGKVTTYKEISKIMGVNSPRAVGQALKRNTQPHVFPCYKVVRSDGSIGGYGGNDSKNIKKKISLLKKDGIEIKKGKIEIEKYRFRFQK